MRTWGSPLLLVVLESGLSSGVAVLELGLGSGLAVLELGLGSGVVVLQLALDWGVMVLELSLGSGVAILEPWMGAGVLVLASAFGDGLRPWSPGGCKGVTFLVNILILNMRFVSILHSLMLVTKLTNCDNSKYANYTD